MRTADVQTLTGAIRTARQESAIVTGLRSPPRQPSAQRLVMSTMRIARQPGPLVRRLSDAVSLDMVGILIEMVMEWLVSDFLSTDTIII